MATIKRFARQAGFSSTVATQLPFFRRKFKSVNYQARWSTYGMWYAEIGFRSSSLSISEFAEFLTFLFKRKGTALSTVKGYRAMLLAVFQFPNGDLSSHILNDLIRSFEISPTRIVFLYSDLISSRGNFCWSLFSHSSNLIIYIVPVLNQISSAQDNIRRFGPLGFAGDRMNSRPPQYDH